MLLPSVSTITEPGHTVQPSQTEEEVNQTTPAQTTAETTQDNLTNTTEASSTVSVAPSSTIPGESTPKPVNMSDFTDGNYIFY